MLAQVAAGSPALTSPALEPLLPARPVRPPEAFASAQPEQVTYEIADPRGCLRGARYGLAIEAIAAGALYGLWRLTDLLWR